ncbi:MAG TPA: HlyD family secretion protein, partial [Patescibacteria group bacterium]|nr:HlyD family secretion protein [Patescibacteria group bacterium]
AQNATGNWVKVVQRLTVRIEPEHNENDPPFRTGMSAEVTIDTGSYPHMHKPEVAAAP